jgi:drug/metabolite transporter (DMT)-like permease
MAEFRYLGETAALGTALFWSFSATSFEAAGKRIGSSAVNLIRLVIALPLLTAAAWLWGGRALPLDAGPAQWAWLGASGLIGYTLGDLFLFKAFLLVGSRISMLVMASAPAMTALLGFLAFKEVISWPGLLGMALIASGISIVVIKRVGRGLRLNQPLKGLLFALGGAFGQALGLILSKRGMAMAGGGTYSVLGSSQIRVAAGILGFSALYLFAGKWRETIASVRDRRGMLFTATGAVCGPFIGVSLSLLAVSRAKAGAASALMSITPVLIVPLSAILFRERVRARDVLGAALAVAGACLMFRA